MSPQGHSIVYKYVDFVARARCHSCLCHSYTYSTFGGNMGCECSAAEHMASYDIVCRWERIYVLFVNTNEGLPDYV